MKRITYLAVISIAFGAPLLVGANASAQIHHGDRCDTPRRVGTTPNSHGADRGELQRAYRNAEDLVDEAADLVRDFDSSQAQRSLRSASDSLDLARAYLDRRDSRRFYSAVRDAEDYARSAIASAEALVDELDRYRDTAHAGLREARRAVGHHAGRRVTALLDDAENHIDSGDRLLYRHDYARARNEFAAAISEIEDACRIWEANREREQRIARQRSRYDSLDREVTNTLASARRSFSGHSPREVDRLADSAIADQERAAGYAARGSYDDAIDLLEDAIDDAERAERIAQTYEYDDRRDDRGHRDGHGGGRVVSANHRTTLGGRSHRGRSW